MEALEEEANRSAWFVEEVGWKGKSDACAVEPDTSR